MFNFIVEMHLQLSYGYERNFDLHVVVQVHC